MKRITLLICALIVTGVVSAQSSTVKHDNGDNTVTITRVTPKRVNQHDLRLGVGTPSLGMALFMTTYADNYYPDKSFREQILDTKTYEAGSYFTGIYSLSYAYHSRRWLQCGVTVNFGAVITPTRHVESKKVVSRDTRYMVSLMPSFRFVYLYREKVQLYSTVSVGFAAGSGMALPWADFTLIGCTFGRKLFGFVELGSLTGTGGCGRVGIGYRIDSKKRR